MLKAKQLTALLARSAAAFLLAAMVLPAFAQDKFPSRPITIMIAFPPGGANDLIARIIAPKLGEILGVPVVVDNKPGGNGAIGTAYVVNAKPDGYTLTLGSTSVLSISPNTILNLPYNPVTDLAAINTVASSPAILAVNPALPVKTLGDLVALAKTRRVTLASAGVGGISHLNIEFLKMETKGDFVNVPYKGAAPAMGDTIGGHVDGIVMDYAPLAATVSQGRLRGLITSKQIGSIEKSNLMIAAWFAVMAPLKTPKDVIATLNAALVKAANDPDVRERFAKLNIDTMTQSSSDDAMAFIKADSARWGEVVKTSGFKPE